MKECFCFLFGLLCGIGGVVFFYRWVCSKQAGRITFLRGLHGAWPVEYHLACDLDSVESDFLQERRDTK